MADADAEATARIMKSASLLVLVAQNSLLAVTMKYSRLNYNDGGVVYIAERRGVICEVLKMAISVALLTREYMPTFSPRRRTTTRAAAAAARHRAGRSAARQRPGSLGIGRRAGGRRWRLVLRTRAFFVRRADFVRLAVPAALYTVQNNPQYFAVSASRPRRFQLLSQLTIEDDRDPVLLLGKTLKRRAVGALLLLTLGVALVQLCDETCRVRRRRRRRLHDVLLNAAPRCCARAARRDSRAIELEKVLKGTKVSLWVRNTQLCVRRHDSARGRRLSRDGAAAARRGTLRGNTPIVWAVVSLQVLGGLVVALVVKYADNILKGFATSLAIVLTCDHLGFTS